MTPLEQLSAAGVSIWLDDLGRHRLESGELARLITERRVVGVTTNPSIFAAAVGTGDGGDYSEQIDKMTADGATRDQVVRALTVADVVAACDVLAEVHRSTQGRDGRVSLEVDPRLAGDTDATVAEARELWNTVDRPNLMVKIPGTKAGLPAISAALAEGISVNVTLIFGLERYREVIAAWLTGLERADEAGRDLSSISSVASFFISRFDTAVDRRLDDLDTEEAAELRGATAIANARLAYQQFQQLLAEPRWQRLADQGARPQRPLWASTSTKDPAYEDTRYVSSLVADQTVNTMPPKTLEAVQDHAEIDGNTITDETIEHAQSVIDAMGSVGVDYDDVVDQLEREGVAAFEKSWLQLLDSVQAAMDRARA